MFMLCYVLVGQNSCWLQQHELYIGPNGSTSALHGSSRPLCKAAVLLVFAKWLLDNANKLWHDNNDNLWGKGGRGHRVLKMTFFKMHIILYQLAKF